MKKTRKFLRGAILLSMVLLFDLRQVIPAKAAESEWKYDTPGIYSWICPMTGEYQLEAWGAQGGKHSRGSGAEGGKGGYSKGTITLTQGTVLSICVGGQGGTGVRKYTGDNTEDYYYLSNGGYNGGGSGCFNVDESGGGGGATHIATVDLGELVNYASHQDSILLVAGGGGGSSIAQGGSGGGLTGGNPLDGHGVELNYGGGRTNVPAIATNGMFHITDRIDVWNPWSYNSRNPQPNGAFGKGGDAVYMNGGAGGGWMGGTAANRELYTGGGGGSGYASSRLQNVFLENGVKTGNGYATITLLRTPAPAGGGSNYINTNYAVNYSQQIGSRSGNGMASLRSQAIGFQDILQLTGVTATDQAAPDKIGENVTREPLQGNRVRIVWQQPDDNGTDYYHKAESYLTGSTSLLCTSNITKNTLTSGIAGYAYCIDDCAGTIISGLGNRFTASASLDVTVGNSVQYLHVAAVDVAGNMGGTTHIRMDAADMLWRIFTRQLSVEATENVYPAETNKTWYVRADGQTPFTLQHSAYMDGVASFGYQLNETIYETITESSTARNIIYTPSADISEGDIRTDASGLFYTTEGMPLLKSYPYSYTVRSNRNKELAGIQRFTLGQENSGKVIQVIPIAGANKGTDKVYSTYERDQTNSITIIGDGEAPVIQGLETLENRELIDRRDGSVVVTVQATDALSGVRDFYVTIRNTDNAVSHTYTPETDGSIRISLTEDEPIFSGDFVVMAYAADNVGNEIALQCGTTEFALESYVERILEPHEPVFQCGESGILTIRTWGYAERIEIEFPEELAGMNTERIRTMDYVDSPRYLQEEKIQFMVPLYTPDSTDYTITVRAFKGDRKLEEHPALSVVAVEGSILDDIRTRLR